MAHAYPFLSPPLLLGPPASTLQSYLPLWGLPNSVKSSVEVLRQWVWGRGIMLISDKCHSWCYCCWSHSLRTATWALWHQTKVPFQGHLPSSPAPLPSVTYATCKLAYTTQDSPSCLGKEPDRQASEHTVRDGKDRELDNSKPNKRGSDQF